MTDYAEHRTFDTPYDFLHYLNRSHIFQQPHDYQFDYAVSDPHTGDHKSQWEVKEKGVVKGGYSLLEPDGTTRIVEYIADDHGFRAVVKKIGTPIHPIPAAPAPVVPVEIPKEYEEPKPIYQDAYSGYYENYVPKQEYEYAGVPIKAEAPQIAYYQPQPIQAIPAPYFGQLQPKLEERVEYHGFTGNADDDSAYTKYGGEEGKGYGEEKGNEGYGFEQGGYSYEESKPQIVAVPYKQLKQYEKPIAYQYVIKY